MTDVSVGTFLSAFVTGHTPSWTLMGVGARPQAPEWFQPLLFALKLHSSVNYRIPLIHSNIMSQPTHFFNSYNVLKQTAGY